MSGVELIDGKHNGCGMDLNELLFLYLRFFLKYIPSKFTVFKRSICMMNSLIFNYFFLTTTSFIYKLKAIKMDHQTNSLTTKSNSVIIRH